MAFLAMALLPPLAPAAQRAAAVETPMPQVKPEAGGFSAERLQRLDRFLEQATGADGYLGAVALIAHDGKTIERRAFGHADLARTRPLREDAIFRIYSMTKPVAAVAVLMLLEEGKVTLDDPIEKYLPELAGAKVLDTHVDPPVLRAAKTPVTIRHLLTHTAGYAASELPGDAAALEKFRQADAEGASDLRGYVERFAKAPLAADPATRFGYESASSEVLARLVEVRSGMPFADFLQQRVFAPLGMHDTAFIVPVEKRGRVVDITQMGDDGKLALADLPDARTPGTPRRAYASGAGGLYSTADDYLRFCQMLLDGGAFDGKRLLGRKTVELMLQNHLTMLDPPVTQYGRYEGFGLGGYVVLDVALRGVPGSPGQFGWSGAASTYFFIDPHERIAAILLLQHLPRGGAKDLPRIGRTFQTLLYQALQ